MPGSPIVIGTPPDLFDEWHALPLAPMPAESPFDVRQAAPDEFEAIYDVVDRAFGRPRPRALYDWIYRDNPFGLARAFILTERASGAILKTGTAFPWPIAVGDEAVMGELSGDAATVPEWQRKGLSRIRIEARRTHPWRGRAVTIAGPNAGSRVVSEKVGDGDQLMGALTGGVLPIRAGALLGRAGVPRIVARAGGIATDGLMAAGRLLLGPRREAAAGGLRVEPISCFGAEADAVTLRTMSWPGFWSPHNADFLNWRYLAHPVESYVALGLRRAETLVGYAVVRLAEGEAMVSEFAAGEGAADGAATLLLGALDVARAAGADYVKFFATRTWRHWSLFRRAGFVPYTTKNHFQALCDRFEPEIWDLDRWQLVPGDRDFQ